MLFNCSCLFSECFSKTWKVNLACTIIEKRTKTNRGRGCPSMCVHSLSWNAEIFKMNFKVILQFFLLIIMAVWNVKQTIMKDYNIQSCQWMTCDRFRQPFLLCTTFRSFLCTSHYFLCAFLAKMATYSLVIGWGCSKTNKGEQGGKGSKPGNLEQKYFLNVPIRKFNKSFSIITILYN